MPGQVKVIIAPDKFKGSLRAAQVAAALARGLHAGAPECRLVAVPVADGGDGTVDAAVAAGFRRVAVRVAGPTGQPVDSGYAERDGVVVAELADACGLDRLPAGRFAPLTASSAGFGEVIRAALDAGHRQVVLGIGGSASTDGGAGMLAALGARLLDAAGNPVPPGAAGLAHLDRVDLTGLHPALGATAFVLASDVDNPLLGPAGAAAVYGPQKGATADDVRHLDAWLRNWSRVLAAELGVPPGPHGHPAADGPGAGAAGGVGFAAMAVLGAAARPGIELLLELTGFHRELPGAALVVIGEGALDPQTLHGKAPAGVANAAAAAGVPVVAVAGRNLLDRGQLSSAGIREVYTLADLEPDLARCLAEPEPLLERIGRRIAQDLLQG